MKIRNILFWLAFAILTAAMLYSGAKIFRYVLEDKQQQQTYDDLAAQVAQARQDAVPETRPATTVVPTVPGAPRPEQPTEPAAPTEPTLLPEYAALYEENNDTVGWITIDGTPINYPVMQSPDRPDYYLDHDFNGNSNVNGCLYVRETCDVFAPSDNQTIYGHHMRNGSMFASLERYRKEDFFKEYPSIRYDTIYERHTYSIFAVFTTNLIVGEGFPYHRFENAQTQAEFDEFVATCKALSMYDTGITPRYGDKLICLSTCEYTDYYDGRLVVAAVRDPRLETIKE